MLGARFTLTTLFLFCCLSTANLLGQNIFSKEKLSYLKNRDEVEVMLNARVDSVRNMIFFEGKIKEGIAKGKELIKYARESKFKKFEARINHVLGYTYVEILSNHKEGLRHYFRALSYYDRLQDYEHEITLYTNIANAYYSYESYKEAIDYNLIGITRAEKLNDRKSIADFENNLAACYDQLGESRIAQKYWYSAAKFYQESGDTLNYFITKVNIIFKDDVEDITIENTEEILAFYKEAIPVFQVNDIQYNVMICKRNMATILSRLGRYEEARNILLELLDMESEYPNLEFKNSVFYGLSTVYRNSGDFDKEAYYLRQRDQIFDTLFTLQKSKAIAEIRTKYESDKKETENKILKQREELNNVRLDNEKLAKRSLYIGIGVITFVLLFVLVGFIVSQRQRRVIATQKKEVDTAYCILETRNKEVLDSINYAKRIQAAILPSNDMVKKCLPESFILYRPKAIVAGDFYWLEKFRDEENKALFAVADCTGHGVPGAMVSVVCDSGLKRSLREFGLSEPGEILDKTNELVKKEFEKSDEDVKDGMDIALVKLEHLDYDENSNDQNKRLRLLYAGANNPLWIIRKNAEEVEEIKADKQPIGRFGESKPFAMHEVFLNKGDTFYLFTDGFADQFGGEKNKPGGKKLKTTNFKKLLLSIQGKSMEDQKKKLSLFFHEWKGGLEQLDDVCVVGVRV